MKQDVDRGQGGYAAAVAMVVAAATALVAAQMARSIGAVAASSAVQLARARMGAACDSAIALQLAKLTSDLESWDLSPTAHKLQLNGTWVQVRVEDERGKIPLNTINGAQIRRMFSASGAPEDKLDALTIAYLDYRDPGRSEAKNRTVPARSGGFLTTGELRDVPGVTAEMLRILAPAITVSSGDAPFDDTYASPLAIGVMTAEGVGSVRAIEREWERRGQRTALSVDRTGPLHGRALTIIADAHDADGGGVSRRTLVELTGRPAPTYLVRAAYR